MCFAKNNDHFGNLYYDLRTEIPQCYRSPAPQLCTSRSKTVADAIMVESKPFLKRMNTLRTKLQKAVDDAKAGQVYMILMATHVIF